MFPIYSFELFGKVSHFLVSMVIVTYFLYI